MASSAAALPQPPPSSSSSALSWANVTRVLTDNSQREPKSIGDALVDVAALVEAGDFDGVPDLLATVTLIAKGDRHVDKDVRLKAMKALKFIVSKCWDEPRTTEEMRARATSCVLSVVDECASQADVAAKNGGLKKHAEQRETYQIAVFLLARQMMPLKSDQGARLLDNVVKIRRVAAGVMGGAEPSVSMRRECSMALLRLATHHGAAYRDHWATWLPPVIDELLCTVADRSAKGAPAVSGDKGELGKFATLLPAAFASCWTPVTQLPAKVALATSECIKVARDAAVTMPLLALLSQCLGSHALALFVDSDGRAFKTCESAMVSAEEETCRVAWDLWLRVLQKLVAPLPADQLLTMARPFTMLLKARHRVLPEHVWRFAKQTFGLFWLSLGAIDNALFRTMSEFLLLLTEREEMAFDAWSLVAHCCATTVQLAPDHLETNQIFWLKAVCALCRQAAVRRAALAEVADVITQWFVGQLGLLLRTGKNRLTKGMLLSSWIRKGRNGLPGLSAMLGNAVQRAQLGDAQIALFEWVVKLARLTLDRLPLMAMDRYTATSHALAWPLLVVLRVAHCRRAAATPDIDNDARIIEFARSVLSSARASASPLVSGEELALFVEHLLFSGKAINEWFDSSAQHTVLRLRLVIVAAEHCTIASSPPLARLLGHALDAAFRLLRLATDNDAVALCGQFFNTWRSLFVLYAAVHADAGFTVASTCHSAVAQLASEVQARGDDPVFLALLPLVTTIVNLLVTHVVVPVLGASGSAPVWTGGVAASAESLSASSPIDDAAAPSGAGSSGGDVLDAAPSVKALRRYCELALKVFDLLQHFEDGVNKAALLTAVRVHLVEKAQTEGAAVALLGSLDGVVVSYCSNDVRLADDCKQAVKELVEACTRLVKRCNVVDVHKCVLSWLLVAMRSLLPDVKAAAMALWADHVLENLRMSELEDVQREAINSVWDIEMMPLPAWLVFSSAGSSSLSPTERSAKKPRVDGGDAAADVTDRRVAEPAALDDGVPEAGADAAMQWEPTQLVDAGPPDAHHAPVQLALPPAASPALVPPQQPHQNHEPPPVVVLRESLSVAMESVASSQDVDPRGWAAAVEMAQNMDNNPHLLTSVMRLLDRDRSRGRAAVALLEQMEDEEYSSFVAQHIVPTMQFKRARK